MPRVRVDVSSLGPGWSPALEWYARAVRELYAKPITDRTSWRYLGAIHGFDRPGWIANNLIQDTDPLPAAAEQHRIWNQCQHASWYFLPWHRGYLHYFEEIVGATIAALGGPADWGLPYWNYFNGPASLSIPAAFTAATMADGTQNPLNWPRFRTTLDPAWIGLAAMNEPRFTAAVGTIGFGGGVTGFNHLGGGMTGGIEFTPHNGVHSFIRGFMGDPDYAALDPIFWLHHCNVDRLWEAWLGRPEKTMEGGDAWRDGPPRQFEMPGSDGALHVFTPAATMPGAPLAPTYDDLQSGTGLPPLPATTAALEEEAAPMPAKLSSEPPPPASLVGASDGKITVTATPATADVKLRPEAAEAAGLEAEQRIFLNLENVRGTSPSALLMLRIGAPAAGAVPAADSSFLVPVALFGLAQSSAPDGDHGGNGINVAVDITDIARSLAQTAGTSLEQFQVQIEHDQHEENPEPVTVERISIYKQAVE
jgi:tyrosinase